MFPHHENDTREFAALKAATLLEPYRIQPDLRAVGREGVPSDP